MQYLRFLLTISSVYASCHRNCQKFYPMECEGGSLNKNDCLDVGCDADTCCTNGPVRRCLDAYPNGCDEGLVLWDNPCIIEIEASIGVISCFPSDNKGGGEQCCQPPFDDIYPSDPVYKTCNEIPSSGGCPVEWVSASSALFEYTQECPPGGCTLETCCLENLCWRDGFCPDGWEVRPEMSCYHKQYPPEEEEEICSVETCCYDPVIGDPSDKNKNDYIFPTNCLEYQEYLEDLGRPLVCNEGGFPSSLPCSQYTNSENGFFYHNCTPNICCRTCATVMTECPTGTHMLEKSCGYDFEECTPEKCCVVLK